MKAELQMTLPKSNKVGAVKNASKKKTAAISRKSGKINGKPEIIKSEVDSTASTVKLAQIVTEFQTSNKVEKNQASIEKQADEAKKVKISSKEQKTADSQSSPVNGGKASLKTGTNLESETNFAKVVKGGKKPSGTATKDDKKAAESEKSSEKFVRIGKKSAKNPKKQEQKAATEISSKKGDKAGSKQDKIESAKVTNGGKKDTATKGDNQAAVPESPKVAKISKKSAKIPSKSDSVSDKEDSKSKMSSGKLSKSVNKVEKVARKTEESKASKVDSKSEKTVKTVRKN